MTLENTEKPKCRSDESCQHIIQRLEPNERPLDMKGEHADPKCRFFYRMGQKPPYETEFPSLNMPNVRPAGFDTWTSTMDKWGQSMKNAYVLPDSVRDGFSVFPSHAVEWKESRK